VCELCGSHGRSPVRPYVEQRLDSRGVLGGLVTCQFYALVRVHMSAVPSWSTGSVGGGVRYGGAVLRSDAAPGLGRKVQLGPKLPPAAESYLCDNFS
jgi:hypothetical protein